MFALTRVFAVLALLLLWVSPSLVAAESCEDCDTPSDDQSTDSQTRDEQPTCTDINESLEAILREALRPRDTGKADPSTDLVVTDEPTSNDAGGAAVDAATTDNTDEAAEPPVTDAQVNRLLLEEIRALRKEVTALRKEVRRLSEIVKDEVDQDAEADSGVPLMPPGGPFGFAGRGPSLKALKKIKLPENPNKEQVEKYVDEILNASANQNCFSSSDPQVQMLAKVADGHFDVLVDRLVMHPHQFYLSCAVDQSLRPKHKKIVLDALPMRADFASAVVRMGWTEDARETLIEGLDRPNANLPIDWIRAVAGFEDPKTFDALKWHFIRSYQIHDTYEVLRNMENFPLDEAVQELWNYHGGPGGAPNIGPWIGNGRRAEAAAIALRHGHADAIPVLIEALQEVQAQGDRFHHTHIEVARRALWRHTPLRSHDLEKSLNWYHDNKDSLTWDASRRRFTADEKKKNDATTSSEEPAVSTSGDDAAPSPPDAEPTAAPSE